MANYYFLKLLDCRTKTHLDSVEWCPFHPFKNFFVCGFYELTENSSESSQRQGGTTLFSVSKNGLNKIQDISSAGVLDQKWAPKLFQNRPALGVALSNGTLSILQLDDSPKLIPLFNIQIGPISVILLSLDWSTNSNVISCSDSRGNVSVVSYCESGFQLDYTWKSHDCEAWNASIDSSNNSILYSGGDDCKLNIFDIRAEYERVAVIKDHTAGVTAIHSNKFHENIFLSGSFDSSVIKWDNRNVKRFVNKIEMPDTVWRIKWDPYDGMCAIVACMRGGVHIVKNVCENLEIVASYVEHKDLSYGVDWSYATKDILELDSVEDEDKVVAVCSFYDNHLSLARVKLK